MSLTGPALVVHDALNSISVDLQALKTAIANAQSQIAGAGDAEAIALVSDLAAALAPIAQRVIDFSDGYNGASNLNP